MGSGNGRLSIPRDLTAIKFITDLNFWELDLFLFIFSPSSERLGLGMGRPGDLVTRLPVPCAFVNLRHRATCSLPLPVSSLLTDSLNLLSLSFSYTQFSMPYRSYARLCITGFCIRTKNQHAWALSRCSASSALASICVWSRIIDPDNPKLIFHSVNWIKAGFFIRENVQI